MVKAFFAVILLCLLVPVDLSWAQASPKGIKIYSGHLYQKDTNTEASFWHSLFGVQSSKRTEVVGDRQCSIEFRSPISFSHQSVTVLPDQLTYVIRFQKDPPSSLENSAINIYTNDDEEYSIDPNSEGKQVGINDEHHLFDAYLVYLILGQNIDHLEFVTSSGAGQNKYVLDKLEVHDNL